MVRETGEGKGERPVGRGISSVALKQGEAKTNNPAIRERTLVCSPVCV